MILKVSFVRRPGQSVLWLTAICMGAGLLQVLLAIMLATQSWQWRAEIPETRERLTRMKEIAVSESETSLPEKNVLYQLRSRIEAVNQITGTGGDELTDILQRLERSLPDDVVVTSLHYIRRQRDISAVAETTQTDNLSEVLQRLERVGQFHDVRLVRQSERSGGKGGMQFQLQFRG